jgi:aspartyl protease family protein
MLRKLLILGVCAGTSASIPIIYETNPEAFHRLVKSVVQEDVPAETTKLEVAAVQMAAPPPGDVLLGKKVRLNADDRGHFTADFKLNGRKIEAMVDTGATLVALNLTTARRIGIVIAPEDFKHRVETANGETRAAIATIARLEIGRISVDNVDAVVLDDTALNNTLIGISFLKRLGRYQVENGALLLTQ